MSFPFLNYMCYLINYKRKSSTHAPPFFLFWGCIKGILDENTQHSDLFRVPPKFEHKQPIGDMLPSSTSRMSCHSCITTTLYTLPMCKLSHIKTKKVGFNSKEKELCLIISIYIYIHTYIQTQWLTLSNTMLINLCINIERAHIDHIHMYMHDPHCIQA